MASSISSNSSISLPDDYYTKIAFNKYALKLNSSLKPVQAFISLSGLFGNILVLIIINKKSIRNTSSAVFITYMAIFDSAVLLAHASYLVRPRRNLFIHCSLTYLTDLFTFCANWVLVIITLERCVAVSSPFLAKRFCTVYSARYSVYTLFTLALIFFSATFRLMYDIDVKSHRKKCLIRPSAALIHRVYQPVVLYAIPDLLLLSNIFTVYILIRRRKQQELQRRSNTEIEMRVNDVHSNRKQRQLTIMLVTVNLAFYLFSTPAMAVYITESSAPKHRELDKLKRNFFYSQISVLLAQLHNATNFIFYSLSGQRFRQATVETFQQFPNELKLFYHRYIICDKHYRLSDSYQLRNSTTGVVRVSCPEAYQEMRKRKSTL